MDPEELEDGELTDSDEETQEITSGSLAAKPGASTSHSLILPRPTNPAMSFRVPQGSSLSLLYINNYSHISHILR